MIEEGFVRMYAHDFATLAARAETGTDVEALVQKRIGEARSHAAIGRDNLPRRKELKPACQPRKLPVKTEGRVDKARGPGVEPGCRGDVGH